MELRTTAFWISVVFLVMPFSKQHADKAVAFIERYCKHTKGEWAGVPFILEDWQKTGIIEPIFGNIDENGNRSVRTSFNFLPRKQGKSEIAAAIALKLLFADSEPGAEIYSVSKVRDQASLVFNVARRMVELSPQLKSRAKIVDSKKTIVFPKYDSFYRAIASDASSAHGFNAHGIICDEVHAMTGDKCREFLEVMETSTGARRQPLMVYITTAGYDKESKCYDLFQYAEKVEAGIVDDPSFHQFMRYARDGEDWKDPKVWKRVNPALGVFRKKEEFERFFKKALLTPADELAFRRLYLNQWTETHTAWMSLDSWDGSAGFVREEELEGMPCYAGVDLSSSIDLTAVVYVFPLPSGFFQVVCRFFCPADTLKRKGPGKSRLDKRHPKEREVLRKWEREGWITKTPGNVIDYGFIRDQINKDRQKFDIREIAYDPWNSTQFSLDLMEDDHLVVPMRQGYKSMSPPTKELEKLVFEKKFIHGGNPVLRWMIKNATVRQDPAGNIKLDKEKSSDRIDGLVAAVMGLDRAIRNGAGECVHDQGEIRFV